MAHRPNIRNASIECTKAITALATLPSSLHERLVAAFTVGIFHITPEDLPDELRADYESLRERATAKDAVHHGEGPVHATVREMSEEDAREVASQVLELCQAVWRESSRQRYQSQ
jgi:hypothetical protein